MSKIQVFSDFDGTITKVDTLNKFLETYADKKWLEIEKRWVDGEIGSSECIEEQMKLFPEMTIEEIEKFIDSVEIDDSFCDFYNFLKQNDIEFFVVSDGFDFFIKRILEKNGVDLKGIKIFSNKLTFEKGKFKTEFPFSNDECRRQSGVCKCKVVKENRIVTNRVLYAGDGLSDFCVSDKVDLLFAKGSLLEYCKDTKNNNLIGFESFAEIKDYIKNILNYKGEGNARY